MARARLFRYPDKSNFAFWMPSRRESRFLVPISRYRVLDFLNVWLQCAGMEQKSHRLIDRNQKSFSPREKIDRKNSTFLLRSDQRSGRIWTSKFAAIISVTIMSGTYRMIQWLKLLDSKRTNGVEKLHFRNWTARTDWSIARSVKKCCCHYCSVIETDSDANLTNSRRILNKLVDE